MEKDSRYWIEKLALTAHPEGGYFKEIFRSEEEIPATLNQKEGRRNYMTSIYFLLDQKSRSHFHILSSDEIWYWHNGGTGRIHFISENGTYSYSDIGCYPENNEQLQIVIPKNTWFAAEVISGEFILVSCAVAPGFDFRDFILAKKTEMIQQFPQHESLLQRFCLL
ncbi:MAG: cupin domain-containing protein [Flavobacteriales bacterium]|nr:cupin domain-containing protein [Flavobacteriales bacterium]